MNSFIAKAHRLQRKSIGLIVASGGVLAFILSFLLIVAGIVMTALIHPPTDNIIGLILYIIVLIFASLMIGILIERLTATNSTKLRLMGEAVEEAEARFSQIKGPPAAAATAEYEKQKIAAQKGKRVIIFLITLGTSLSMLCESFCIHFLFTSWDLYVGWIASFFLSGLVSYTLISSELHKKHEAAIILDSLDTDNFLGVAAHATIKDRVHERMLTQSTVKVDEIANSAVMLQAIDQAVIQHVDEVMHGGGEIVERITDEREQRRLAEVQERERTRQQLTIIHGGRGDEDTSTSTVVASFDNPKPVKSKNHQEIEELYRKFGEVHFSSRTKNRLSSRMNVTVRHIDRILNQIKEEMKSSQREA
ncbi:MAG TPA: hypothetical protein VHV10_20145 [Ktedonobacteraceae bacterium]|nr:hypothetical protein [Ktedonobacteraceae bacterium]